VFGNLFRRKNDIWSRLEGILKKLADGYNPFLVKLEAQLRRDLDEVLNQVGTFWFQKSRTEAIRDGDRNSRYYHLITVILRRLNRIESLQDIHGTWHWDEDNIKCMVTAYFMSLYKDEFGTYSPYIAPRDCIPIIAEEELAMLQRPFMGSEVKRAIFDMKDFKAPGPDGFQALFLPTVLGTHRESTFTPCSQCA